MQVHWCDYSSQPEIRIACTQEWTTPTWSPNHESLPEHVHEEDNGRLYTFEETLVSCPVCKNMLTTEI